MHFVRRLGFRLSKKEEEFEFALTNSGLPAKCVEVVQKNLKNLQLDHKRNCLSRRDLLQLSYAMGINPTDDLVEANLRMMKLAKRTTFTLGHFAHMLHRLLIDSVDEKKILERAFYFFDRDGNGEISLQELITTMRELGGLLEEEEIERFCTLMDKNHDGVIEYSEFLKMLRTQAPVYCPEKMESRTLSISEINENEIEPGTNTAPVLVRTRSDCSENKRSSSNEASVTVLPGTPESTVRCEHALPPSDSTRNRSHAGLATIEGHLETHTGDSCSAAVHITS